VIEAADADVPLRERVACQDVALERGDVVRELVELRADLVERFEVLLTQDSLRHGCATMSSQCGGSVRRVEESVDGLVVGDGDIFRASRHCGAHGNLRLGC
jgi:hypothetical protein